MNVSARHMGRLLRLTLERPALSTWPRLIRGRLSPLNPSLKQLVKRGVEESKTSIDLLVQSQPLRA
jgi:hypothetical protein